MKIFDEISRREHEQVVFCSDQKVGLRAIIAVHNTTLGPALGGTRMWTYATEDDALQDVLRLSRAMTYKASIAGLNLGGGKAVIIGDAAKDKTEGLFRTYGRFVETLGGRFITSADVGTEVRDLEWIRMETRHVTGVSPALGGSGDPSIVTGFGVYMGMKACAHEAFGSDSLKGRKIAVQGAGKVATYLCKHLAEEGAELYVTDIDEEKAKTSAKRFSGRYVQPEKILELETDIVAPCALGGILNDETIPKLKCKIVAGGANNQLLDETRHSRMLAERNILYAPDYAINSGGLMSVGNELTGGGEQRALKQAEGIYDILLRIFATSKSEKIPTSAAANKLAEQRIQSLGRIKHIFSNGSNGAAHAHETSKRV